MTADAKYVNTYNALVRQTFQALVSKMEQYNGRLERQTADEEDEAARDFYSTAADKIRAMMLAVD